MKIPLISLLNYLFHYTNLNLLSFVALAASVQGTITCYHKILKCMPFPVYLIVLLLIVFHVSYMQGDEENDSEGQNQFTGAF